MNCPEFDSSLDTEGPEHLSPTAHAHAATCPRCARAWSAARALEQALERGLVRAEVAAPERLLHAVMQRVQPRRAHAPVVVEAHPIVWWVRLAAQPSSAAALVLAALWVWRGADLAQSARQWFATGGGREVSAWATALGPVDVMRALEQAWQPAAHLTWVGAIAVALSLSPLALLASYALYRLAERLSAGPLRA